MYDLCVRKEQFAADREMENQVEGETLTPQRDKAEELNAKTLDTSLVMSAVTQGSGIAALRTSILGKRHHSLYEGLNGCEMAGFGKNGTDYGYLVRQNSELLRALDELERTCASLRQENVLLRKSSSPETEEKVKRLKRKNAELAVIAKRLEERARKLQEANLKVANTPVPLKGSSVEQYKKAFARQRAHDLAEQAETLLAKDKEIEALRVECRELQSRFGKGKGAPCQSGGSDFERLLRESQKEVLRLQRQLALSSTREPEVVNSQGKAKTENALVREEPQTGRFEKTNGYEKHKPSLTPEHPALEQEDQRLQQLETELCKKRKECENLEHEVWKRQKRCQDLESELNDVRGRNARLKEETGHLIQKAELLDQVQSENDELRDNLSAVTAQRNSALEENQRLQAKLDNLEQVLKQMREVAERRQHLESEHEEALNVLRLKQDEVQRLQKAQVEAKREHEGVVQLLEVKVRELEVKCRSQSEQFALLCHELERFRLQAGKISVLNSEPENTVSAELDLQPQLTLYNGVEVPEEKEVEAAPLSAPASPAAETPKEEPVSEEVSVQHIESTAVSTESAEEPTPTTPKSESQQVTPKSESFQHSTPKSCPTPEVDTASEVEELDIDVSPIPEPESGAPAKLQVFIARYSYNPFDGPNENPEAELPLTAGEYIYACGDMDEDGFYEGELMDGRRGLVPSNFVERVSDDDMMSFHPPEVSDLSHNSYQESSFHSSNEKNLRLSVNSSDKTELSVPEEEEEMGPSLGKAGSLMANGYDLDMEEVGDDIVPYPRRLTLIKQLAKSIIISWDSPLVPAGWGNVWSYNVYVDKELRLNVPFGSQTKAVLERLDINLKTYRISVQSLTEKGNSDLLQCSFLVGRNVCVAPTQLKVETVTATSANLTWLPSNSNYVHAVSLNEEEYEVVKAGCYTYCLSNLRPNMRYKVKVEARPLQTPWELPLERWERKCTVTAFTTLMAGPPDAPLDIQVESGPSPGIVLVSWLPVTIDAAGTSNGVRVTGYAVYADTQKVLEVASPTAGSVLVGPSQIHFLQVAKELTIRTMSPYGESVDSVPVKIPPQLFRPTAHCQPLQMLPSASSTSDVCVHTVPPYRDALENTTAKTPALLTAMLQSPPLGATPNSEAAELHDLSCNTSVLCKEDRTLHINTRTDPLLDATSVSNNIADVDLMSAARSTSHEADIPEEDLTKDSENSSVKRPTATIADFLEEAEWTEAADSSAADVAVDRSDSLLTDEASADTAALVGSPIQTLEAVESEQEAEEETSRGKVRLVSVEEFLDDTQEESELRCKPEQEESRLKGPEKEKEECLELPEPRRDHRLNEYRAESSRGSDLSDILEEDEEELCSDTAVNEEGEEPASGHSIGEAGKETVANGDPRLQHSAEVLGKTGRAETRPANEALQTGNPGIAEGSEAEGIIQDNAVRIFVALFAYDPASMSPNPDAAEEELPFEEGQIIKIHGDKDADGFYHGESRGRFGYVPCNMVSEIQVEDEETRDQLLQQGYLSAETSVEKIGTRSHAQLPRRPIPPPKPRRSKKVKSAGVWEENVNSHRECSRPSSGSQRMTRPRRMVAVFDYDPRESSPNVDVEAELTFSAGDVIVVFGDMDDDGFFYGDLNGQQGLAPSNFLQALPENGAVAAGGVSEEKVLPAESRRESQVSLEGYEEQNDSAVNLFEEPLTPCPMVGITAPPQVQVPSPESPGQSDTSPPGKKKRGFFSKGKKLFKKLGSSKKE